MLEFSTSVFQEPFHCFFSWRTSDEKSLLVQRRKREENPLNLYQTENWCLLLNQVVMVKKKIKIPKLISATLIARAELVL